MQQKLTERQAKLPGPQGAEQVQADANALVARLREARECGGPSEISHDQFVLNVMDLVLRESKKLGPKLAALAEPATKLQIANHLGLLVKSFPNAGKNDIEIYGKILPHDVAAQRPTIGAIEAACRHLRRTSKFIPSIAEIISTLSDAEAAQRDLIRIFKELPLHRSRLEDRIKRAAEAREQFRREMEDRSSGRLAIVHDQDDADIPF